MKCAVAVAPIRAEPDDTAEQVTQALLGEPLLVEEERDGWARVRTSYDYPGWLRLDGRSFVCLGAGQGIATVFEAV